MRKGLSSLSRKISRTARERMEIAEEKVEASRADEQRRISELVLRGLTPISISQRRSLSLKDVQFHVEQLRAAEESELASHGAPDAVIHQVRISRYSQMLCWIDHDIMTESFQQYPLEFYKARQELRQEAARHHKDMIDLMFRAGMISEASERTEIRKGEMSGDSTPMHEMSEEEFFRYYAKMLKDKVADANQRVVEADFREDST